MIRRETRRHAPGYVDVDLGARRAFQCRMIDHVNELDTESPINAPKIARPCPVCSFMLNVSAESDRDRIDCVNCAAALVTRRDIAGVSVIQLGAP